MSEIVALKQEECPSANELIKFKAALSEKIEDLESSAKRSGDILGVTGYTSGQDVCEAMFHLLGLLELVQHAYAEHDSYESKCTITKGRLVGYLQMLSKLKRPSTGSSVR